MATVTMSIENLRSRGNNIRKMLRPISYADGPAWETKTGPASFVIGMHDGAAAGSDYRGWTFATSASNLRAQYFERWLKSENRTREYWYLDRAYLNIYKFDQVSAQMTEILCLHCDPYDVPDPTLKDKDKLAYGRLQKQSFYKQHPHLHVKAADPPFPKAHIALQLGFGDKVLASVSSLSAAMHRVIEMLKHEVFDEINSSTK